MRLAPQVTRPGAVQLEQGASAPTIEGESGTTHGGNLYWRVRPRGSDGMTGGVGCYRPVPPWDVVEPSLLSEPVNDNGTLYGIN